MKGVEWIGLLIMIAILLVVGFGFGLTVGSCTQAHDDDRRWQADAAKRGFGSFIITDSLSGATKFQWRNQP